MSTMLTAPSRPAAMISTDVPPSPNWARAMRGGPDAGVTITEGSVGEKEAAGTGSVNGGLGLEELPSATGIPGPKSGRSSRAPRTSSKNLLNDVDFQQARSSPQ